MNAAILTFRRPVASTARDKLFPSMERSVQSVRERPIARPVLVCRWYRDGNGRLACRWELVASADPDCRSAVLRSVGPTIRAAA